MDDVQDEHVTSEGVVVLLDALGTRTTSLSRATEVLKQFETFISDASNDTNTAMRCGERLGVRPSSMKFRIMGDMIALLFPFPHLDNTAEKERNITILSGLGYCIHRTIVLFLSALESSIFLRGAMSFGPFVYSKTGNTVVGPAITDAANWCETADWIGVHLTPSCGMYLERIQNTKSRTWNCVLYDMPLSAKLGTRKIKCWCCNWPDQFSLKRSRIFGKTVEGEIFEDRNRLIKHLTSRTPVFPFGVESKYLNTLEFFDYCCNTGRS